VFVLATYFAAACAENFKPEVPPEDGLLGGGFRIPLIFKHFKLIVVVEEWDKEVALLIEQHDEKFAVHMCW